MHTFDLTFAVHLFAGCSVSAITFVRFAVLLSFMNHGPTVRENGNEAFDEGGEEGGEESDQECNAGNENSQTQWCTRLCWCSPSPQAAEQKAQSLQEKRLCSHAFKEKSILYRIVIVILF